MTFPQTLQARSAGSFIGIFFRMRKVHPGYSLTRPPLQLGLVEQAPQILGAEVSIAQDAGEGSAAEFPVQRNDERMPAPRLLQAGVTAALTDDFPALLAKLLLCGEQ